jgi:CysZ protein
VSAVAHALFRAVPLLFDRRVLLLAFLPLALAVVVWLVALYALSAPLAHGLADVLARWLGDGDAATKSVWVSGTGAVLSFLLLTLGVGALVLAAIAVAAAPVFIAVVASRHFPALERKHGGTVAGGIANALVAVTLWLLMWIIVLPLLLLPIAGVPASLAANAWLNQRLFRYDALAEHASAEERTALLAVARGRLFGLGLALSPLTFVPVVNLIVPIYAGLAFTFLCLDELAALRARSGGVA